MALKKGTKQLIYFSLLLFCVVVESGYRDPGSGMNILDPKH
jgi:hypothetical protein